MQSNVLELNIEYIKNASRNLAKLIEIISDRIECHGNQENVLNVPDFNLSGGCFGTDIIKKCKKWSQIGVHRLICLTNLREFSMRVFFNSKNLGKLTIWARKENTKM